MAVNQDQISHGHAVMRIDVSRKRRERTIGMRIATGGMCSKESGIDSNSTFMRICPFARSNRAGAG